MSSHNATRNGFVCFELRGPSDLAEAAAADAFEVGAAGLEERDTGQGTSWLLYAPGAAAEAVARVLAGHTGLRVGSPARVTERDWSEEWKRGLGPIQVSPELCVRPSFTEAAAGGAELVIDPGQAFGTGGHASTRLALEWVAELAPRLPAGAEVLDVGCGSGVLALAALRLGAARAVALDLDPLAAAATRENAAANGLASRTQVVLGPLEALRAAHFALVVANLLRSELLPLLTGIAARTAEGGRLVLSGLLAEEEATVERACAENGLRRAGRREHADATGDHWISLLMTR